MPLQVSVTTLSCKAGTKAVNVVIAESTHRKQNPHKRVQLTVMSKGIRGVEQQKRRLNRRKL